jgi:hypothetical protein
MHIASYYRPWASVHHILTFFIVEHCMTFSPANCFIPFQPSLVDISQPKVLVTILGSTKD